MAIFNKDKMAELVAKARAAHEASKQLATPTKAVIKQPANKIAYTPAMQMQLPLPPPVSPVATIPNAPLSNVMTELARAQQTREFNAIELNDKQQEAIERGLRGQSFVLIGAAGTGKTTTTQELIKLLQRASHMRPMADSTKHLNKGAPGFVIVGYTNKAVNNIRKRLPPHLQDQCITIHKLIESAPEYFDVMDDKGNESQTMRFMPQRNRSNPLPFISTTIVEESSMVGTDLHGQMLDGMHRADSTQFIFLGDIFQLPPVFGPSILGFKMSELPVVELTHVYRQALESPIISLATAIRLDKFNEWMWEQKLDADFEQLDMKAKINARAAAQKLTDVIVVDKGEHGKVTIRPWKKRLSGPSALKTLVGASHKTGEYGALIKLIEAGQYNPDQDQVLCPFNVSFGTIELNKGIADYLAKQRDEVVYEVIARYQRNYFAVGDRVMVDRHDAVIMKIEPTIGYVGKPTQPAGKTLDRWGVNSANVPADRRSVEEILNELDAIAEADEDGKNLASHKLTVWIPDLGEERILTSAGEINSLIFSYVLTVHKSQGSEWGKVFILLHNSHQMMLSRELLYTAITRAKNELYIICEGDFGKYSNQLRSGSNRAVVPGTTLKEKIEYFKGKGEQMRNMIKDDMQ